MKKKNLLLSLLAVFALGACNKEEVKSIQGEQGEKGEAGLQGPQGEQGQPGQAGASAYQMYKQLYPSYQGDEAQWINDLVNGRLANGQGGGESQDALELTDVYMYGNDFAEDVFDTLVEELANASHATYDEVEQDYNSDGSYDLYTYSEDSVYYDDDVELLSVYEDERYCTGAYNILTNYNESVGYKTLSQNNKQFILYNYDVHCKGLNFMPSTKWNFWETYTSNYIPLQILEFEWIIFDYLDSYGSFIAHDEEDNLYGIYYSYDLNRYSDSYQGYSYDYIQEGFTYVICDLNTLQDPRLNSFNYIDVYTCDHDEYGRELKEPAVTYIETDESIFEYGGETLSQVSKLGENDVTRLSLEESIPAFDMVGGAFATETRVLAFTGDVVTGLNSPSYDDFYTSDFGGITELSDDTLSFVYEGYEWAQKSTFSIDDVWVLGYPIAVSGSGDTKMYSVNYWTSPSEFDLDVSGLEVTFDEGNTPDADKLFDLMYITDAYYNVTKDFTPLIVDIEVTINRTYDELGAQHLKADVRVFNPTIPV